MKHDGGKPRLELLPDDALDEVARILTFGAETKYEARNWEKGFDWSRLVGAAKRHLSSWSQGDRIDPETGRSHLAHASCMILFLLAHELRGIGTDDMPTYGRKD